MSDFFLYGTMLSINGQTDRERLIEESKSDFLRYAENHPGNKLCKRNGKKQKFLIDRTEKSSIYKFVTFPNETISVGDIIEVDNNRYLITEVPRKLHEINQSATGLLCNHLFKWQDSDGKIIEKYGYYGSSYATNTTSFLGKVKGEKFPIIDGEMCIFLPYDEDTKYIYIDQRFAVGHMYNEHKEKILNTVKVVGLNNALTNFNDGHLIVFNVDVDIYSPEKDNIELGICNYKKVQASPPSTDLLKCEIQGKNTIRLKSKRTYKGIFYDSNNEVTDTVECVWTYPEIDGVKFTENENSIDIQVDNDENLLGQIFEVRLNDNEGKYKPCILKVEVVM